MGGRRFAVPPTSPAAAFALPALLLRGGPFINGVLPAGTPKVGHRACQVARRRHFLPPPPVHSLRGRRQLGRRCCERDEVDGPRRMHNSLECTRAAVSYSRFRYAKFVEQGEQFEAVARSDPSWATAHQSLAVVIYVTGQLLVTGQVYATTTQRQLTRPRSSLMRARRCPHIHTDRRLQGRGCYSPTTGVRLRRISFRKGE